MNFNITRFQLRKYREETVDGDPGEGTGGEEQPSTTSVLTDEESETGGDEPSDDDDPGTSDEDEPGAGDETTGNEDDDAVPETYADFTLPEDISMDELALEEVIPIFKELKLSQSDAQKLVDFEAKRVQAGSQAQIDSFNQLMTDWKNDAAKDSEFGGDNYSENVKVAQAAIAKYGTPELKQLLTDHGVGNHPEMIRFMFRVGQTLKEDVPGGDGGNNITQAKDRVTQLYGNQSE